MFHMQFKIYQSCGVSLHEFTMVYKLIYGSIRIVSAGGNHMTPVVPVFGSVSYFSLLQSWSLPQWPLMCIAKTKVSARQHFVSLQMVHTMVHASGSLATRMPSFLDTNLSRNRWNDMDYNCVYCYWKCNFLDTITTRLNCNICIKMQ